MPSVPPERPAGGHDDELERGADDPDRVAAGGEAGHQAVARAGTEARSDVEAAGDAVEEHGR
jgi:hypothetical protein